LQVSEFYTAVYTAQIMKVEISYQDSILKLSSIFNQLLVAAVGNQLLACTSNSYVCCDRTIINYQ
jgi:hypothetical protein